MTDAELIEWARERIFHRDAGDFPINLAATLLDLLERVDWDEYGEVQDVLRTIRAEKEQADG